MLFKCHCDHGDLTLQTHSSPTRLSSDLSRSAPGPTVSIYFEPADDMLVINGVDAHLARNPLLAAFLRQHRGTVDDQCRALVPTGQDALSARYQAVSRLLNRLGVGIEAKGQVDRKSVV